MCCLEISATHPLNYGLSVTHSNANKVTAVLTRSKDAEHMDQVATIGDSKTDVLMFHKSGVSIVVGNATEREKWGDSRD